MKSKKIIIIIGVFICLVGLGFSYMKFIYPYDWDSAEKNFKDYIKEQGTYEKNISHIEKLKDTKLAGILYRVKYKDDPNLTYEYLYRKDDKIGPHHITLIVYDKNNSDISAYGRDPKYKDLE